MSFKDEYHPKVKRDIKKLDREVIQEIFSIHMEKILQAPYKGYRLHGELEEYLPTILLRRRSVIG